VLKDFRKTRKQRKKEKMEKMARDLEASATSQPDREAAGDSGAGATADAADGVEIEIYAATMGITPSEVWSLLRRGELLGRTEKGKLLVFARPGQENAGHIEHFNKFATPVDQMRVGASAKSSGDHGELPPLPPLSAEATNLNHKEIRAVPQGEPQTAGSYLTVSETKSIHPEISLLLDHLSLAKEENREIIKLTQDALSHVSSMTDTMIKMKDQLITAKEEQLLTMREVLSLRDQEIRKLKQEREDLEMLTRTLAEQK